VHVKLFCAGAPFLAASLIVLCGVDTRAQSPPITLAVDASQAPQQVLHTRMVMPVVPGPLTLHYAKWIPGEHGPFGPISRVAGLKFTANGRTIPWRRDLLDPFAFHLNVPEGAGSIEAAFDFIEPAAGDFSAGASATTKLVVVNWNQNLLYPAGVHPSELAYQPVLRLPRGWKFGTALPVKRTEGDEITFNPVTLERLVDSPVLAGQYYRVVDVTPTGEPVHHEIDIAADSEVALEMPPGTRKGFTDLVAQTGRLFGARHYREYHFLLTLSDHVAHFGLEHHDSDDSRVSERLLLTPDGRRRIAGLLCHEFVHSWNGKFRRPADLATPDYETPMRTDLLWVYEGLTNYLGNLLAARSGLWTAEQYREYLATTAAELGPGRPGRTWRPLQDTADAVPVDSFAPPWLNWSRGYDYYPEGDLLWLEVAMMVHNQSNGHHNFEDFCRRFYGGPNNGPELKPYTFEDLVSELNQLAAYDWAGFLRGRLESTSPGAPIGGIAAGGWKVEYSDKPPVNADDVAAAPGVNATYSIGLSLAADGTVQDSLATGLAYQAGISPGMKVMAVNDRAFTPDLLREVLSASKTARQQIRLLVLYDDYYKTSTIEYEGGERYPHLARAEGKLDLIDALVQPLAAPEPSPTR
jgi:predicted metalloprotease with PDZ domain